MGRMPGFTTWVRRQRERDDEVGDVGKHAMRPEWPAWAWKREHFEAHLREHGFRGAQRAFRAAWTEHQAYVSARREGLA